MSLINCPDCQKEVSPEANRCPSCGYQSPPETLSIIIDFAWKGFAIFCILFGLSVLIKTF
jgi:hypothetical protein